MKATIFHSNIERHEFRLRYEGYLGKHIGFEDDCAEHLKNRQKVLFERRECDNPGFWGDDRYGSDKLVWVVEEIIGEVEAENREIAKADLLCKFKRYNNLTIT
jgi:hypothetical protein